MFVILVWIQEMQIGRFVFAMRHFLEMQEMQMQSSSFTPPLQNKL